MYSTIEIAPMCKILFMEILHFKELGDIESVVVTNAVCVFI